MAKGIQSLETISCVFENNNRKITKLDIVDADGDKKIGIIEGYYESDHYSIGQCTTISEETFKQIAAAYMSYLSKSEMEA